MQNINSIPRRPVSDVTKEPTESRARFGLIASCSIAAILALVAFYLSLVATSAPLNVKERLTVEAAIKVLEKKGFDREAFLLRHVATFRASDNWLNSVTDKEQAFAATNFPFEVVTLYPDFYTKASDDIERAMVLLHEAQHLFGKDERGAYRFVWQHREQLGWTQSTHGATTTYTSIAELTRENAPDLFNCGDGSPNDCSQFPGSEP